MGMLTRWTYVANINTVTTIGTAVALKTLQDGNMTHN